MSRDDLEMALRTTPEERARQLLEVMRAGYRLKYAALRARYPAEPEEDLEERFRRWLAGDDRA